ncbi:MAG: hypothetical protein HZA54_04390 [Planctomycetes bacterium]|nr:hypothetical protein [Planctomycetota bacterium]
MIRSAAGILAGVWQVYRVAAAWLVAVAALTVLVLVGLGAFDAESLARALQALRGAEPAHAASSGGGGPTVLERLPEGIEEEVRAGRAATAEEARRRAAELDAVASWVGERAARVEAERRALERERVRLAADRTEFAARRAAAEAAARDEAFRSNLKLLERRTPEEAAPMLAEWSAEEAARYLRALKDRTAARILSALEAMDPATAVRVRAVLHEQAALPAAAGGGR